MATASARSDTAGASPRSGGDHMALEVHVLDLGDIELDTSFLVLAQDPGRRQEVPTFGFLILGGEAPIVVDTGFSEPSIMGNLGMQGWWRDGQGMEGQLERHG